MSLNRTLVALIASVTATGCEPLLPPVHAGWCAQGGSQVVLERRITLKLLDQGAAARSTESR